MYVVYVQGSEAFHGDVAHELRQLCVDVLLTLAPVKPVFPARDAALNVREWNAVIPPCIFHFVGETRERELGM